MATNSQEAVLITLGGKPPNRREKLQLGSQLTTAVAGQRFVSPARPSIPLYPTENWPAQTLLPYTSDMRARSDYPVCLRNLESHQFHQHKPFYSPNISKNIIGLSAPAPALHHHAREACPGGRPRCIHPGTEGRSMQCNPLTDPWSTAVAEGDTQGPGMAGWGLGWMGSTHWPWLELVRTSLTKM